MEHLGTLAPRKSGGRRLVSVLIVTFWPAFWLVLVDFRRPALARIQQFRYM
jgi:hypothetical protein